MTITWSKPTTTAEAIARARGRARFNSVRQFNAMARRAEVLRLYVEFGGERGSQSRIARMLNVDRSTVSKDIRAALRPRSQPCPTCGSRISNAKWKALAEETARNQGLDPRSIAGQAEILAAEVVNELLPRLLADLGFFTADDGRLEHADGHPVPDSAPTFAEVAARAQEALRAKGAA